MSKPKVLYLDIETAPILSYVWGLWGNDVALNQIKEDTHLLSWAAKWQGEEEVMYMDQRNARNLEDDKKIIEKLWKLMDDADIIIGHNSRQFDIKRINSRILAHGLHPTSSFKQIDTLEIAKKYFNLTSNKLEYLANLLLTGKENKKLVDRKFSGFSLWTECLSGNLAAWKEMEAYNKRDVEVLEKVHNKLSAWDTSINFSLYTDEEEHICQCGSKKHSKNGFFYTAAGKYQRYKCTKCGKESRDRKNLFTKEKRESLRK